MSRMIAIAAKDIRIFLTTWTSYMVMGIFMVVTSFFFQRLVIEYQLRALEYSQYGPQMADKMNLTDWVMGPLLLNVVVFFLFMLPILTMRLLAEERHDKTLDLLLTLPVRSWDIVLGKYLAALFIMVCMLTLTGVFPVLLSVFGESAAGPVLDWASVGTSYLGLFLLGSAFVAIGLLTSSLTDSQIVAVITAFGVLLMFYVIGLAARGQTGMWEELLRYLSLTAHLESFSRGVIVLPDVVYYLSLTSIGLFLTERSVEAHRWRSQ